VAADVTEQMTGYTGFGVPLAAGLAFPGAWATTAPAADATVLVDGEPGPEPGGSEPGWEGICDGEHFAATRGPAGEHYFTHGGRLLFALSPDARTLTGDPAYERDIRWWRVLLDSVLFTVALLRGRDALHAGAIATPAGIVAVCAGSGGGKSTLLAQLLTQENVFVTDDILFLDAPGEAVTGHPGPPLMTLARDRAAGVGSPLGEIGGEVWTAVPVAAGPQRLRRLVLLDRRPGAADAIEPVQRPLAPLMHHLLTFPRTPEREASRFELASAIATRTEVCRLSAGMDTPPQRLAELALEGLAP
jgi:hypothetical protein